MPESGFLLNDGEEGEDRSPDSATLCWEILGSAFETKRHNTNYSPLLQAWDRNKRGMILARSLLLGYQHICDRAARLHLPVRAGCSTESATPLPSLQEVSSTLRY